ncbi:shikimate dehydrogenase [Pseudarthrobacter sp. J1763]|uniref:shikimate dehydrogenase n=1 Tax=Pseudarthrobacter sp. J1763 TaxID=3420445 RepID=UPI003D2847C3
MNQRAAVLGHPIGHSKSPALHLAAYKALGLDIGYERIDVTEQELPELVARVRAEQNWCGLSVTMPLKRAMVSELDEVHGIAAILGAVNTVVVRGESLVGYNTDVAGIVNALRYVNVVPEPRVAILGGGGTAIAAVAAAAELAASTIEVLVRNRNRADDVVRAAAAIGTTISVRDFTGAAANLAEYDVVISTLPPQAGDFLADEFSQRSSTAQASGKILLDVAYDPWPSALAAAWQQAAGTIVPGLEMLLYQAVEQVKMFTGAPERVSGHVIDVMCDSVGAPRR